jgi:hypothetical protein
VQVALVVERDRLEEHDHAPAGLRQRDRSAQHARRVVAARSAIASIEPGMSRRAPIELSLWKWPPKPFW